MRPVFLLAAGLAVVATSAAALQSVPSLNAAERKALAAAVASPARSDASRARDRYRNPQATLAFFGVRPRQTVVELFPGGGWYSEVLAPYVLNGGGTYYVAAPSAGSPASSAWSRRMRRSSAAPAR